MPQGPIHKAKHIVHWCTLVHDCATVQLMIHPRLVNIVQEVTESMMNICQHVVDNQRAVLNTSAKVWLEINQST